MLALRAQTSPGLQPPPIPCAWQRRPFVSAPFSAATSEHDVGPVGGVAIARVDSAMLEFSAEHPPLSTGTVVVVGVAAHAASLALLTVKVPDVHEPPTVLHEHMHVAVESPAATFRSTETAPSGQLGRAVAENDTAVQPAGAS